MPKSTFSQGLAAGGVWYAVIVLLNLDARFAHTVAIGAVAWLLTAAALTVLPGLRTWLRIVLALPIFFVLGVIIEEIVHSFPQ